MGVKFWSVRDRWRCLGQIGKAMKKTVMFLNLIIFTAHLK